MKSNREQRRSRVKLIPGLPYDTGIRVPRADDKTANMVPQKEDHKKIVNGQRHRKTNSD